MSDTDVRWVKALALDELELALIRAFDHDGPSLVEVMTDVELVQAARANPAAECRAASR